MEPAVNLDILIVEDDEDIRAMLCMALEDDGYTVDGVPSAEAGLERLHGRSYHLVVSDYMLPGRDGAWLFREAGRVGLLHGAACIMITAHPDPDRIAGVTLLRKPLDLDGFFDTIHEMLAPARRAEAEKIASKLSDPAAAEAARPEPEVELVLYISAYSPSSLKALRTMERLLEAIDPAHVRFTVRDLSKDPSSGDEDHIAFTPTLVKRRPEPRTWIRGDLESGALVADLLRYAGVQSRDGA